MKERGPQLGLPQALMRWGQQRRGPWWLEVVEGGLRRGHPSLGLGGGGQRKWLRGPGGEPPPAPLPGGACGLPSKESQQKPT